MNKNRKGQAAMEFLMTYGWAILVVLVVIGALAYFGVLNPANLVSERCTMPQPFSCEDFAVTGNTVAVRLRNGIGKDIEITSMNVSSNALADAGAIIGRSCFAIFDGAPGSNPKTIPNGESLDINVSTVPPHDVADMFPGTGCVFSPTGNEKNKYTVTIIYRNVGSVYPHTIKGEIFAKKT